MKNLFYAFAGMLLLVSCQHSNSNMYDLTGKITGQVPAKVYLQYYGENGMNVIDSANFVNGEFKFKGTVPSPDFYYLRIGNENNLLGFFLENSKIYITANVDSLRNATVTGSAIENESQAFNESKKAYEKQLNVLYQEFKVSTDEMRQKEIEHTYDSIENLETQYIKQYVFDHGNSILAPYIIRHELIYTAGLKELEELTNALSPDLKENKYTKELHTRIELLRTLQPGMDAPQFTQNDVEGNPVNLTDFKGKYLLIDFWASWCHPCRQANPTVVKMYKKYHNRNFEILGVSMDSKKDNWVKAIQDDDLVWSQVSSLQGWDNPVGKLYGVNSIPHQILIDPEGKIVKRGIHAEELDDLLGSTLK